MDHSIVHKRYDISKVLCKKDRTTLLTHWIYVFLALSHQYFMLSISGDVIREEMKYNICACQTEPEDFVWNIRNTFGKSRNSVICGYSSLIARFMGPSWGPSGADRAQVGPMLAPWTLLSGLSCCLRKWRSQCVILSVCGCYEFWWKPCFWYVIVIFIFQGM